jgi:hypothetical protein
LEFIGANRVIVPDFGTGLASETLAAVKRLADSGNPFRRPKSRRLPIKDDGISILLIEQNALAALDVAQYAWVINLGEFKVDDKAVKLRNHD